MKNLGLLVVCYFLLLVPAYSAYTGRVYIDSNRNGIFDKGDKPMAGIMVSDGRNVVKTLADGSFSLDGHDRERFIVVTTPSGYKCTGNYYHKIEQGKATYDFVLQPWTRGLKNDGSHKFIQIADTEIFNTVNQDEWANNVRDYAANEDITFIMHTGDICYENGLKNHIDLMNSPKMGCPMYYCIGNHDLVKGKYGEELFESIYGPVFYSFDYGNVHYIVTPMAGGDYRPGYTKKDVYEWLKNDLANIPKGTPVIAFNHDLLTYGNEFIFKAGENESINLDNYNLKAWIYGHWHINHMLKQGNVKTICTSTLDKGGIDHSTSAFRVISADKNGEIQSKLKYTYIDKAIGIASINNDSAPIDKNGSIPLSVNVYSTVSDASKVLYTCESDGKILVKDAALNKNTDWNWSASMKLPSSIEGKRVFVIVKAFFANGEVAIAKESFTPQSEKYRIKTNQLWANMLQNSAHIGISNDTLSQPMKLGWIANIGSNIFFTSPIVADNSVFIASVDEDYSGKAAVYSLDAIDGKINWIYKTKNSIKNSIAFDGGNVFAQDTEGNLYAINAKTGKLSWERKLDVLTLPSLSDGLTAHNGVVYAGSGKGLVACNGTTGNIIWQNKDWAQGDGTTSTISLGNNVVVSGANWRALYGNDAQTGKLLWSLSSNGLSDRGATPAIHGNSMYVISRNSLFVIDVLTGNILVRKELPFSVQVTSTPLVTSKFIIFGSVADGLIALDKETLELKWKFATLPAMIYTAPYTRKPVTTIESSPVLAGQTVYFGTSSGMLYGVDIETGKEVWKHSTGSPVFNSVAISGNALFAADFSGNVYAFVSND